MHPGSPDANIEIGIYPYGYDFTEEYARNGNVHIGSYPYGYATRQDIGVGTESGIVVGGSGLQHPFESFAYADQHAAVGNESGIVVGGSGLQHPFESFAYQNAAVGNESGIVIGGFVYPADVHVPHTVMGGLPHDPMNPAYGGQVHVGGMPRRARASRGKFDLLTGRRRW